jgi:hypothetical protein
LGEASLQNHRFGKGAHLKGLKGFATLVLQKEGRASLGRFPHLRDYGMRKHPKGLDP